jgi:hypothetical protein
LTGKSPISTEEDASGQLRGLISPPTLPIELVVTKIPQKDARISKFMEEAIQLGLVCTPLKELKLEVSRLISSRMVKRDAEKFIWQTATPAMRLFPAAATVIFPSTLLTKDDPQFKTWTATTKAEVLLLLGPLLAESPSCCAGLTKAFKTASERVIRVVATVMPPATLQWKAGHLSGTFWYILFDEEGELHPPKTQTADGGRAEVALTPLLEQQMREQVLSDVLRMGTRGDPLAPGFLRQIGREADADVLQAQLLSQVSVASASSETPASSSTKKARRLKGVFQVDCILEEKPRTRTTEAVFLVRWMHDGYDLSWEVYRTEGEGVGEPMATWEPLSNIQSTEALAVWRQTHP